MTVDTSKFEYTIKIPVPMGTKVWTFWTNCCNACAYQPREDQQILCHRKSPCHTLKHSIQNKVLSYNNLEEVINGWGTFYFATQEEAQAAGEARIQEHIKQMRELGYVVDNEGKANYLYNKEEAWRYNIEHKEGY